jgi:hypothetical protein
MTNIVKTGLVLGVLVEIWTYIFGFAGWYLDPSLVNLFYVVVVIQLAVLYWGLKKEAAGGKQYGALLGAGTTMSVVAAVIVFIGSMLFTTVFFPQYFAEVREMARQTMLAQGNSADLVEKTLELAAPMQTPLANAIMGALMTILAGFIFSLFLAVLVRSKRPAAPKA